jgi:hypothetical protein
MIATTLSLLALSAGYSSIGAFLLPLLIFRDPVEKGTLRTIGSLLGN